MPTPAPVTLGRVSRVFALLCDLGLDAALEPPTPEALPQGPSRIEDQAPRVVDVQPGGTVQINVATLVREVGRHGALDALGAILYDVTDEEASELPVEALEDALVPFFARSAGLIEALLSFARGLA